MSEILTPEQELEVLRTKVALLGNWNIGAYQDRAGHQHWYGCARSHPKDRYVHEKGVRHPPGLYFYSERQVLEAIISALTDPKSPYEISE